MTVMLSPEFPFIYLPSFHWNKLSDHLKANAGGECQSEKHGGYCKFKKSCSQLNQAYTDFDFSFEIRSEENIANAQRTKYKISGQDLLVPGVTLGLESSPNICYYAVFRSMVPNSKRMHVGQVFFDDKYIVWDQTPKQNNNQDYIQVGIGAADPDADVGEI